MEINPLGFNRGALQVMERGNEERKDKNFQNLLRLAQAEQDDKKLKEACQDIEAIFIYKMLQQMRATIPEGGFLSESSATRIYRDMLDEAYSREMARSRDNLGLGEMLYRQLKQQYPDTPDETTPMVQQVCC